MPGTANISPALRTAWIGVTSFLFAVIFSAGNISIPIISEFILEFLNLEMGLYSLFFKCVVWALCGLFIGYVHGSIISKIFPELSILGFSVLTSIGIFIGTLIIDVLPIGGVGSIFSFMGGSSHVEPDVSSDITFSLGGYYASRILEILAPALVVATMQALALSAVAEGCPVWILRSLLAAVAGGFVSLAGLHVVAMASISSAMMSPPPLDPHYEPPNINIQMAQYFAFIGASYGFIYALVTFGSFRAMRPKTSRWSLE